MFDTARVRTRWRSDPHYVNVDLDGDEIGYLQLTSYGEVTEVVHDPDNAQHRGIVGEIHRLAEPIASAAASCKPPEH